MRREIKELVLPLQVVVDFGTEYLFSYTIYRFLSHIYIYIEMFK